MIPEAEESSLHIALSLLLHMELQLPSRPRAMVSAGKMQGILLLQDNAKKSPQLSAFLCL